MSVRVGQFSLGDPQWDEAIVLRRAVLRTPLGLDYSAADLAAEREDMLFCAYEGARLAGVVMLRPDGTGGYKLRQMAVLAEMRGRKVGEQLVAALEARVRELGGRHIGLAARKDAIGFYERQGYVADGEEFVEVTLPHRHMSKTLD